MKLNNYLLLTLFFNLPVFLFAQNGVNLNGTIDDLNEFSEMRTVPITMPDGTKLMTDLYRPITQDSLIVNIDLPTVFGTSLGSADLEVIPRGVQLFIYDSINGQPNPNPYRLPMVLTRTPYGKNGDIVGRVVSLMGFSYALQDMRGRYTSEGVYMPMFSDSWNKNAYHNSYKHILDITPLSDPRNGNRHEDGYNTVKALADLKTSWYDLDGDGVKEQDEYYNSGSIAMFGASALANTQLQAAAAHKIDPTARGLKGLFPIVGTNEHYRYTGYNNGVFRERIVTGWIRGQIADTDDNANATDNSIDNAIHSSTDYLAPSKFVAANRAIDHFTAIRYDLNGNGTLEPNETCGFYPNSIGRADMDASAAPVNADGESVAADGFTPLPNLNKSRYNNMDVPIYHLAGWWDIFVDGQLQTWRMTRKDLKSDFNNQKNQKIVIGPWAHQTIGGRETGDRTYPANVGDIIGFAVDDIDIANLDLNKVLQSEIISWFRLTMNSNPSYQVTGPPKVKIPKSNKWQSTPLGAEVRLPAEDFIFPFEDLINFLAGTGTLKGLQIEIKLTLPIVGEVKQTVTIDVPTTGSPLIPGLGASGQVQATKNISFDDVPNVRFYVAGPDAKADSAINPTTGFHNAKVGNYWFPADTFPLQRNIAWQNMYLHKSGAISPDAPTTDEGNSVYVDDPNNPVYTVGGANMIVETPDGSRISQGQMQMNSTENINYCLNRPGVLKFETAPIQDSLTIAGYPKFVLYARSNPAGLTSGKTDTDYFIRVADEYPDGRIFFVFEGCVNARARMYAKNIYDTGTEDASIPYSNIDIGQVYEYKFEMMPIAYSWGKGHKMKIMVQGSNNTRYQSNPHIPLNDYEFFRRQPSDGQSYTYNGQSMAPRTSVERIYFAPDKASRIELPIYTGPNTNNTTPIESSSTVNPNNLQLIAYPNPADDVVYLAVNSHEKMEAILMDIAGKEIMHTEFVEDTILDVAAIPSGIYFISVKDTEGKAVATKKVVLF